MALVKNTKWTIGGPELAAGTAHAMEYVIPIRGSVAPMRKPGRMADPAIIGSNMDVGDYLASDNVAGSLPLTPRCVPGFGKLVKSLLGTESTHIHIAALIRVRYTGASASCKITASSAGNTLVGLVGVAGSEGASFSLDLTAAGNDTVGELVAVVEALADYECQKVFGDNAASTKGNLIVSRVTQAKNKWAYIWVSGTGNAWERDWTVDFTGAQRPTYSIQGDGYEDEFAYTGAMVDKLKISGALKSFIEADADVLGFAESIGAGASALTLEDRPPLFFYDGNISFNSSVTPGTTGDYAAYIRNISIEIANNSNPEGYGQGSVGRQYHEVGFFSVSGDLTLKLDAVTYLHRAAIFASPSTTGALSLYFKTTASIVASGGAGDTGIPEMLLIEIPWVQLSDFTFAEDGGRYTANVKWKAIYAKGTVWDVPLTISMVSADDLAF